MNSGKPIIRFLATIGFSIWIFTGMIILAPTGDILAGDTCINMEIWSDKQVYLAWERINIGYTITNQSTDTLATLFAAIGEHFHIKDQDGKKYIIINGCYIGSKPDTLMPGLSFTGNEQINTRDENMQPGTYTCFPELPYSFFSPPCQGAVTYNTIEFTIKEPKGLEAEAFELYVQAQNIYWGGDKRQQAQVRAYQSFLNLARGFPNSVYAPQSLKYALFGHRTGNHRGVAADGMDFIETQKDIPDVLVDIAVDAIAANYKTIKDKSAAIESMSHLIDNYPGTRISEQAAYRLEEVKDWEF